MKKKILTLFISIALLTGCGSITPQSAEPYDGKEYIEISSLTSEGEDIEGALSEYEPALNYDTKLSVPTFITCEDGVWFIVDCYHNRVICSEDLSAPLDEWTIMCPDATMPHTIASDGTVYLIDDTENNRVLVYEKKEGKFLHTQSFYEIGSRPHYTVYDSATDTFYVWSSTTGELYCFRHTKASPRMYLTDIRKIDELDGIYVRSFSIIDGDIYFVSGVSEQNISSSSKIYRCDLDSLGIKETISVPASLAGMVQITKIQSYYYITISTDLAGSQDSATLIRCRSLYDLSEGSYEDIYSEYFIGGGTPYYISNAGDTYFLTEHRLSDHSIWSFKVKNNQITEVTSVF